MRLKPSNIIAKAVLLIVLFTTVVVSAQDEPSVPLTQMSDTVRSILGKVTPVSGPVRVVSQADKLIITVGDMIHYTMSVQAPEGSEVAIPPPGTQLGRFLIRDYEFSEPQTTDQGLGQEFSFDITAYATGELVIPAVPVIVKDPSGAVNVLITEAIRIRVSAVTNPDDLEVRDVKAPLEIPINYTPYILGIVAGLLFIAAVIVVILYFTRWRSEALPEPEPIKPPHILAYEELRVLDKLGLLEAGEFEAYYTMLSEIMRRYIALRWKIYALEYTSNEIMDRLKHKSLGSKVFERVRWFLDETDLVKFARYTPVQNDRTEVFERTKAIVDWTSQAEPSPLDSLHEDRQEESTDSNEAGLQT